MEPHLVVENYQQMLSWQRSVMKRMSMEPHLVVENHSQTSIC